MTCKLATIMSFSKEIKAFQFSKETRKTAFVALGLPLSSLTTA